MSYTIDKIKADIAEEFAKKYGVCIDGGMPKTATGLEALCHRVYNKGWADCRERMLNKRWIPCSERLPRRNVNVLVYRPGMAMPMLVDRYEGYYGEDDDEWYEGWAYSRNCTVIAWMPLPEPYKESEE